MIILIEVSKQLYKVNKLPMHIKISFIIFCTCIFVHQLNSQSCQEEQILETSIGSDLHHLGWSVDTDFIDANQFVSGAPGKERCYHYQLGINGWEETIIERSGSFQNDDYGYAVAVDGDRIVVGAPYNDLNGTEAGAVYVYDWDGVNWVETQLLASNGSFENHFGYSVDVFGDRIIVGAPKLFSGPGLSYIFDLVGGVWEETILNPSTGGVQFGRSVDMKNDTILIGAPSSSQAFLYTWSGQTWVEEVFFGVGRFGIDVSIDGDSFVCGADLNNNVNGSNAGSVYIFDKNGTAWDQTIVLASDGASNDYFGRNVSISGDSIVAGVVSGNAFTGKVYVLDKSNGAITESQVTASDGHPGAQFGQDVSIEQGKFIVGARYDSNVGNQAGAAYLYEPNGGILNETKFHPSDAAAADRFGYDVGVHDQFMVVGAERDIENAPLAGAAYIYEKNGSTWDFHTKLMASDGDNNDGFGTHVDVYSNRVLIGTPEDSDNLSNAGSAYIFEWDGMGWNESKITASNASVNARFGNAVAIYGDRLVVGNINSEVFVFELVAGVWTETEILIGSNTLSDDQYGYGLDIYEDRIAIGASNNDAIAYNAGSTYVYDYDGNTWLETIVNGSAVSGSSHFGWRLALDVDRMVVGAPGNPMGEGYVFDYDGTSWVETQILVASDVADADGMGVSVGLHKNKCILGAPGNDDAGGQSGSAYVFELIGGNWVETKMTASDAGPLDFYGQSVDIFDETTIVGTDSNHGRAYIIDCPCIDQENPVAVCQDLVLSLDISGSINILAEELNFSSYDDCGIVSMSLDESNFNCNDIGVNPVVLTVTDTQGNSATCSSMVEIQDPLNSCIPCGTGLLEISTADIIADDLIFGDAEIIESDAQILNDNIQMIARTSVELLLDFEVQLGKVFTVEIGPCP